MSSRQIIFFLLFLLVIFILLYITLPDYGLTWDESLYFEAGDSYISWMKDISLHPNQIDFYWHKNAQHPPLVKMITGLTGSLLKNLVDKITAYRIAEILWFLVLIILVFFITKSFTSLKSAYYAALSILTMPRIFAHAHFVELDLPLSVLWLATIYCYYRGLENWRWGLLTGLCFGLSLLTKVTAVFLFIPLLIWSYFLIDKKYTNNLFSMIFLGFGIFILFWPWLWQDTFSRIINYYALFFTFKSPLQTFYFGKAYSSTPWHYPVIMTFLTIPLPYLFFTLYATWKQLKEVIKNNFVVLLLVNILFFWILFMIPGTLVIDGIRYFMPIFPMVGILTGIGFDKILQWMEIKKRKINKSFLFVLPLLPSLFWIYYLHPAQLSYYNLLIGGPKGAEKVGMEMTYWGEILGPNERDWINRNIPKDSKVKILPVFPANAPMAALSFYPDVIVYYQKYNYLRHDIRFFADPPYDYFILISRQGLFDSFCWNLYRNEKPVYTIKRGNVQLLGIYQNPLNQ